ncbi:hypothetical protein LCM23_14735 [Cytobacillus kochii]|uniref:hypothetical protein n=1 Tax=Cytobacillus kochii TaxID=859143 RepID=UPI001CD374BF|nr:hypothetical protein [Cytobacillus kochii]MCA1027352.1 hypothetical protein [Cytobacillus kochii]
MIILDEKITSINIEKHGNLDFSDANIIVRKDNGFKSWEVDVVGADEFMTKMFIEGRDTYELRMIDEGGKEYSGKAILGDNGFIGTGKLEY